MLLHKYVCLIEALRNVNHHYRAHSDTTLKSYTHPLTETLKPGKKKIIGFTQREKSSSDNSVS